jgi:uncharacterized membrane protein
MNRKQLATCKIIIGVLIGAAVLVSVTTGNVFPALAAIFTGMAASYICSRRMTEVVNDEMVYRISERASRRVIQVFTPVIAVIGLVIITLNDASSGLYTAGLVLAYSACGILILYMLFYSYYSRKGV